MLKIYSNQFEKKFQYLTKILFLIYRKKAKSLKEKAKKEHEKLQKQYIKRQSKAEVMAEKELKKLTKEWETGYDDMPTMPHRPSNVLMALKAKMTRSSSQGLYYYI